MSSEPSLLQMPDIVLTEIVKKCDYPSIQSLRKVCRDLRNIVEDVNPEFHFTDVYIMHTLYLILTFNNTECIIYPEGKRVSICYKNNGLNCIVFMLKPIWNEPDPLVNTNSIDRFCADFAIAMSSEKSIIQKLAVNLSTPEDESICNDHAYLVKSLKSKISLLKVQKLELSLRKNSHIIDFLQLLDPNYLQTIQITSFSEEEPLADIDRISKLEQFKKAKELVVHLHFITTPFEYFSHFEKVTVWYRTVTMDMLRSLAQVCPDVQMSDLLIVSDDLHIF
ncbi:hypothetical protein GCK72_021358 [Caenorhabditis remanei]|uniref:F-box domain-containing protein n=1 Tax=Caenorhabditis remanei TaxID=31234 RepID=A0A6A5GJ70_CAERE|nr:hypothetical protein GCK72_021358 [Caenorhabditis remanei]KAF1754794.1 hypothetical protein GCK72_021358 [Caenorhabditis remanei]